MTHKSAVAVEAMKDWGWKLFRTTLIIGIGYIIVYPILLKVSLALRGRQDIYDQTIIWFPKHPTMENFLFVLERMKYWDSLLNTLSISTMAAVLQMASCALAGYGFARLRFKGQGILFILVVFTIIVPPQTIMIPTYMHYRFFDVFGLVELFTGRPGVNLLDTKWPFVLASLTATGLKNGLYIYIFRQFFRSLPNEIEEAALVDGAGVFRTFWRVMLPNAMPAIVTVVLFSFVWQYNDSFYVSMYLTDTKVLSMQLAALPGLLSTNSPEYVLTSVRLNAGIVMVILPLVLLYLLLQKQFVESVERSGIVG
ncbi:carbohydrate ABC transporter permease [Paenibacillus sp. J5C_2022]|uniref:carbohydrate ABC transporter permease n=1 Tax=Paenibacillus sp. J5C2022 TaxID=2977129 RepID=UPI0021CF6253|nr:carbohydrate ABC transporter permease [Paenibacillus sp. J5C2022]MCU6711144.1 carbohydrate ABC transporter permease [Paenibacillus sp. J5C2022]